MGGHERDSIRKTQVHRNRELLEMTPEQVRDWAQAEVARALDRESVRATHAAKLDDCIRSLISRLYQLVQTEEMSKVLRDKLTNTIILHNEIRSNASD